MQDVDKLEIKEIEWEGELVSERKGIMTVEPLKGEMSESIESSSSSSVEEKSDGLPRKNSIEETPKRTEDVSSMGLRNVSDEASTDVVEPSQTELNETEQDAREPLKPEELMTDAEDGRIESAVALEIPDVEEPEHTPTEKSIEASSSKVGPKLPKLENVAGVTALRVAFDNVVHDELAVEFSKESVASVNVARQFPKLEQDREKTELELEMELFEASERVEEARLLASLRSDQSMQVDSSAGSLKEDFNDRKRALDSSPNEARKKRGKRRLISDDSEEDVCFICFDGGDLVLCDRRTCPKAYHLSCIGRDAAFFQKKGAWICGWHFCSICTKPANFQCYTCPTAYCNGCLNKADFLCVRQRKGLCEECWPIVKMIENKETVNAEGVQVDFTDQETYECLFKEYWEDLKLRLLLTPAELDKDAKVAGGSEVLLSAVGSDDDKVDIEDYTTESDDEFDQGEEDAEGSDEAKKRKKKKRGKSKTPQAAEEEEVEVEVAVDDEAETEAVLESDNEEEDGMEDVEDALGEEDADDEDTDDKLDLQPREFEGWASKELIEFLKFMNEDPKKPLSKFQVTKLLWSYIKAQKLQDPRKKTQIICDDRFRTLFGKKIVGQSEMYKHLQAHFAPKAGRKSGRQSRDEQATLEADVTDADGSGVDEKLSKVKDIKDKRRRRKGDEDKFERPNVDEFAAVTPKNIGLIYLRRQLLEELLDDPEFDDKVCNTFVRIRVPGMSSKSEMCYRLVQVAGTRLQAEHYKAGRKTTNIVLEILNLHKREDVTVDLVSNHDFNEEECQRLRQSIKCGFIKTLTVGDIEEKARSLQEAKVNDWFETERQRLVNLRDRASEKGRKKELRECVEKLQELNSPAFRAAKLHARPEVTADPRMDPNYESDCNDDKSFSIIADGISNLLEKSSSPVGVADKGVHAGILKGTNNESSRVDRDGQRSKHPTWAGSHRSKEGDRGYAPVRHNDKLPAYGRPVQYNSESASDRGYDDRERGWEKEWVLEQHNGSGEAGWGVNGKNRGTPGEKWNEKVDLSLNVDGRSSRSEYRGVAGMTTPVFETKSDWSGRREQAPPVVPSVQQVFPVSPQHVLSQAVMEAAEKEKIWHYMDPTGTVQGPFAMEQLRKWNTTGYFPEDLRIWKANLSRDESILLTDGLVGRFYKQREPWPSAARLTNPLVASIQEGIAQALTTSSSAGYSSSHPALKSGDGWRENGGASSWADRGGSSDVGRSTSWGADAGQSNRSFVRDAVTGPTAPLRDTNSDIKWKPGPAATSWDPYGRTSYSNSPTRSGRADAAARFDPANWGSRSASVRPERDGWGSSPAPVSESGGYSKSGGKSSWGRGSNFRDSGGTWNPDESAGHESSRTRASRASRKDIPCRFHQKGYCKRGDSCDFWHG